MKTLWEKEKILATIIVSYSHNVFYPFKEKTEIFVTLILLSANAFNLASLKLSLLVKSQLVSEWLLLTTLLQNSGNS